MQTHQTKIQKTQRERDILLTLTASVERPDSRYDLMTSGLRGSAPLVCWAVTVKSTVLAMQSERASERAVDMHLYEQ